MKFCPNCEKKIELEGIKFCYECGFKLDIEISSSDLDEFSKVAKIKDGELISYTGKSEDVLVPGGISVIGKNAFSYNLEAKSITLSSGVTEIKEKAFGHVPNVTKIYIPETVTKIDRGAFSVIYDNCTSSYAGCIGITEIIVDENNPKYKSVDGNLYTKDGKILVKYAIGKKEPTVIVPEGVLKIDDRSAFYGNEELKKISLPSTFGDDEFILHIPFNEELIEIEISDKNPNYKTIDGNVYSKDGRTLVMYNVTKNEEMFVVPKGVTTIDVCAFSDSSLESIIIPNGVEIIKEMAFQECYNLATITLPNTITEIDASAFTDCESLKSIALPSGLTKIEAFMFQGAGIESINIPSGIREIDDYAFSGCYLSSIYVPSQVKRIGCEAFSYCTDLAEIVLSEGLAEIEDSAFSDCQALKSIKIPSTVYKIGEYAFDGCKSLKTIYIAKGKKYDNLPENVKVIEY